MSRSKALSLVLCLSPLLLSACTGLVAGPPVETGAAVAVPRDSAWARARRAFTAEVLTIDLADSLQSKLYALRYPRAVAAPGSTETCRIQVRLLLKPAETGTALVWQTRWVAPAPLASQNSALCETERQEVLSRIQQTIVPPS